MNKISLLPDHIREKLLPLRASEIIGLAGFAWVKFYASDIDWTWYASGFDGDDVFFGLVIGYAMEFGYFKLSELEQSRVPLQSLVERDEDFEPTTLQELRDHYLQKGWAL